ncbi:IPT/TIG domain-containing protein [Mesobacillus jeotgali]|uniref:IPT/TIG domain-containing protein n=1 Tax=Mesobacillus jeotgali TaxID=129985 RepID=A0ABY9VFB0_9BACI|nr:IPT/TIG domain-containing protein [Mesobacillus jeotgali]WNF22609.1 IPT/TIG domain-containing protein [Mesobacillus jeotgali]
MKNSFFLKVLTLLVFLTGSLLPYSASATTMSGSSLVAVNKTVETNSLVENSTTEVTLTIQGTPQDTTTVKPNDVILIVDKSGSMQMDNRLEAAKTATKEFIDLMDLTKHRVGIVDFSDYSGSFALTTDASAAKSYVDSIQLSGSTNTGDAIRTASNILANHRPEAQPTIVILTDGAANSEADALASAQAAKDQGIIFYSIALLGPTEDPNSSAPNQLLKDMSTSAEHHHFVLGSVGLSDVYKQIVEEIGLASAYNVNITDTISPEFEIVPGSYDNNIPKPTVTGNTLVWNITELKTDQLTLKYQIRAKDTTKAGRYSLGTTNTSFVDNNMNSYVMNTVNPIMEVLNPKPVISIINSDKGLTTGGEIVTITGMNFLPGVKVYFGNYEATVTSESNTEIVVTTPIGAQGTAKVKVLNSDGQFALGDFNYYADPTLSYVTPAEGPMDGGNRIAVIGSNFMSGAKVLINGIEAQTEFSTVSKLYGIVPASPIDGFVSVKVINPDGTEVEKADAYNYLTPAPKPTIKLTSLSATSGLLTGGESVYLIGENFDTNVKVYFGDKEAPVNYYASPTKIRVSVPAGTSTGLVNVKAQNPDASESELPAAYEYLAPPPPPAPEISYLSDNTAMIGEQKTVYLFGKNISPTAKVFIGNQEASVSFVTTSKIRITVPVSTQPYTADVKLVNPDGQSAILAGGFIYAEPVPDPAPIITSLSDNSGLISGNETVIITGQNFKSGLKVYFGDRSATIDSVSATEIQVRTPVSSITGNVTVKVVNPDLQESTLADGYNYEPLPITVTKLSVTSGSIAGGNLVYIYGTNFNGLMTVTVNGQQVPYTFLATTRIRIKMPAASAPGPVDITVDRAGAQASITYTYY